jgi:hypothetical protein
MLEDFHNKMIDSTAAKNKEIENVTIKAVSASVNEYHFPGVPDFLPMSVRSTTIEEATEIWKIRRQPTQRVTTETPAEKADTGETKDSKSDKK